MENQGFVVDETSEGSSVRFSPPSDSGQPVRFHHSKYIGTLLVPSLAGLFISNYDRLSPSTNVCTFLQGPLECRLS